jgi:trans-2,3-dihydro-3-hydroxyanthranilate isomerase
MLSQASRRAANALSLSRARLPLSIGMLVARRAYSSAITTDVTFETVDVFSSVPGGGNKLAVCFGADNLSDGDLKQIAIGFGYSETTFVLPPADPDENTAKVRIFDRGGVEMPFAGHPNVGTAAVIARKGELFGRAGRGPTVRLEEIAGVVPVEILYSGGGGGGEATGAMLTAPEPWRILPPSMTSSSGRGGPPVLALPPDTVAACLGLETTDIVTERHAPLVASCGLPFVLAELTGSEALGRSRGIAAAFEEMAKMGPLAPPKILPYVREGGDASLDGDELLIRCRMHRSDGSEDAGTGSANAALMGLLAHLDGPLRMSDEAMLPLVLSARFTQGVEMGRPSELLGTAEWQPVAWQTEGWGWEDGGLTGAVGAVRIGGHCVPVGRGELECAGDRWSGFI